MIRRLAHACFRHRMRVVIGWVVALIILMVASGAVGTEYRSSFTLPDVESKRGADILEEHFGGLGAGPVGTVVFRAEQGVDDPAVRRRWSRSPSRPARRRQSLSPYTPEGDRQIAAEGPEAGTSPTPSSSCPPTPPFEERRRRSPRSRRPCLTSTASRSSWAAAFADFEAPSSEAIGIGFAIIILVLAFGSVLAMGLPIGVALAGIGVGSVLAGLLAQVVTCPTSRRRSA